MACPRVSASCRWGTEVVIGGGAEFCAELRRLMLAMPRPEPSPEVLEAYDKIDWSAPVEPLSDEALDYWAERFFVLGKRFLRGGY